MSNIALFNVPFYGHINPTLGLVREIARRKEQVDYYSLEKFREPIEQTGARFLPLPSNDSVDYWQRFPTWESFAIEVSLEVLPILLEQLRHNPPKLLIYECSCLWGRILGKLLQVPTVTIHPYTFLPPDFFPPITELLALILPPKSFPLLTAQYRIIEGMLLQKLQWYCKDRQLWTQLKKQYPVEDVKLNELYMLRGDVNIVLVPEAFLVNRQLFDDSYIFTVPCYLDDPTDPDFPLAAIEGKSVIYISLGTAFNNNIPFFRKCLQAFAGSEYLVVMSVGKSVDIGLLGEIPPNFIIKNWVPQQEILKRTKLFIIHGGSNSVFGALMYQVPLIVYPQGVHQYFIASRVQELGAGKWLKKKNFQPHKLRQLAQKVMNSPEIRRNVEQLNISFAKAESVSKAVDKILELKSQVVKRS